MPYVLDLRIATEIVNWIMQYPLGNPIGGARWSLPTSGTSLVKPNEGFAEPGYWRKLGIAANKKGRSADKVQAMFKQSYGHHVPFGLRCNEFAAAMTYFLELNRNLETCFEIVRMGRSATNCHYIVVLGRQGLLGPIPLDRREWRGEIIILDPWGAKQSKYGPKERAPIQIDMEEAWITNPRDFGNILFSVCRWEKGGR